MAAIERDQERRLNEIRVLLKEIERLNAVETYRGVLVGGDFNFEPDDPEYRELEHAGLKDIYAMSNPETEVYSFDPQRNVLAGQGGRVVPSTLRAAMRRLPKSLQQNILEAYQTGISEARRIDFLFLMTHPSDVPKGCFRHELFGHEADNPGSDHYGVFVSYIPDVTQR